MSQNMASTSQRYEAANKKFNEAYDKYAGNEGMKLATETARKEAKDVAGQETARASDIAAAKATTAARTAGLSKAKSALMAKEAASETAGNTYGNLYGSTYGNALTGSLSSSQQALSARGQQLGAAQQEGQSAYNRAWGNLGGAGEMASGILLPSDERLKDAQCVSSQDDRIKKFKEVSAGISKKPDWQLLKVTYKKEKK